MAKLTARQAEIFQYIQDHIEETGFPPTRAEIAKKLGFRSPNAAEEHLKALARKGVIEIIAGTSRGIRIPPSAANQGIPVVGQVAAGHPILAEQNIDNYCQIPANFFTPHADYFLTVKGMSMQDCGILDGDLLAVHKTPEVHNGQIVVARIEDEVTVKRFERKGDLVLLHPENSEFSTIEVDLHDANFTIEGISVGVIRH